MAEFDFRDFYIGYETHPRFQVNKIVTDDLIRVIIQKFETIIFTNKGDLLGDPNFGGDLERLLYETKISASAVRSLIIDQINLYISELKNINYSLSVRFEEDPENFQDVMIIEFSLVDFEVFAIIR
jgi:hypothetical protein